MVSKIFRHSVWEVPNEFYAWRDPSDPVPDLAVPEGWEFEHRNMDGDSSCQGRLQISTRGAFENLRTICYISNIKRSKGGRSSTPFQLTVICQLNSMIPPL